MPIETPETQADGNSDTHRFQCRHIFTDGHRCGSPALRLEHFCYYHHSTRPRASARRRLAIWDPPIELPLSEDRASIQLAIAQVILRIAEGSIDPKRARLLLYALQIASRNLPRLQPVPAPRTVTPFVEEPIPDPEYGVLAPIVQLPDDPKDDPRDHPHYADGTGGRDIAAELARKWRVKFAEQQLAEEASRATSSPNLTHTESIL